MTDAKRIEIAFGPLRKSRQALIDPIGGKIIAPSGQNFMTIGLMPYVPHELVVGCVENVMQGDGQFDYPQASPEMPAVHRNIINDELPKFVADLRQKSAVQRAQVFRRIDSGKKFSGLY